LTLAKSSTEKTACVEAVLLEKLARVKESPEQLSLESATPARELLLCVIGAGLRSRKSTRTGATSKDIYAAKRRANLIMQRVQIKRAASAGGGSVRRIVLVGTQTVRGQQSEVRSAVPAL
jgi:hypothetical protein